MIGILQMASSVYTDIIADPAILIDNGIPDVAPVTDTQFGYPPSRIVIHLIDRLIKITTHHITADHGSTAADTGSPAPGVRRSGCRPTVAARMMVQ